MLLNDVIIIECFIMQGSCKIDTKCCRMALLYHTNTHATCCQVNHFAFQIDSVVQCEKETCGVVSSNKVKCMHVVVYYSVLCVVLLD